MFDTSYALPLGYYYPLRGNAMSEVDFLTTSFKKILQLYFTHGCVLLRNFANVNDLTKLIKAVDGLYTETDNIHIYPRDLRRQGLPQFHEYIFVKKHYSLLNNVFSENIV
jgi:hypothetical protein